MSTQSFIQLERPGLFVVGKEPISVAEATDEVTQVAVKRIGICGTDIHAFHGRQPFFEYPRVLGHELGVEILPDQSLPPHLKVGMSCAVRPYVNALSSPASIKGKTNCCEHLRVLGVHTDGGMRSTLSVPTRLLHPGEGLHVDQLALVEMLSIGYHAIERARLQPADTILVVGAGPIGMSVASLLHSRGADVAVADVNSGRLAFCRETLGVANTVLLGEGDPVELVREVSETHRLPSVIFDATGNSRSMERTFDLVAHGGTIILVGLFQGRMTFDDPNFHRRELTLMASRNATAQDFEGVMTEIRSGRLNTGPWITHRLDLFEVPEKFAEITADPTLRKAMISVGEC